MPHKLNPNANLAVTGSLVSPDGRFTLVLQTDGNLVLYGPEGARWSSGTYGKTVSMAAMQADGNFVLRAPDGLPVWDTATHGHPGAWLGVRNDGNIAIYAPSGKLLWASTLVAYTNQFNAKIPVLLLPLRLETKFVKSGTTRELWLRIFPDDIAVNKHRPTLSPEEIDAGTRFWTESRKTTNDRASGIAAWRLLAGAFGAPRAAWIAERTQPDGITTRESVSGGYESASVEVMPDYYEIRLYQASGASDVLAITETIKTTGATTINIDIGLNAGNPIDALPQWVTDFNTAISMGLGIKIPLTETQYDQGFSRVEVVGVRCNTDAAQGKSLMENLMHDHRFAHSGLSVLPPGAPANNTSDSSSDYAPRPDVDSFYDVQFGPSQFILTNDLSQKSDGQRLAECLGLAPSVFQRIPNAGQKSRRNAETINVALWQATLGYFLEEMFVKLNPDNQSGEDPALNLDTKALDAIRDFFVHHVKARGALPAIRIGKQPYGILPVMALKFFGLSNNVMNTTLIKYSSGGKSLSDEFRFFLSFLLEKWESTSTQVKTVDDLSSQQEDAAREFMQIVGLQPHSIQFHQRIGLQFGNLDPFADLNTFQGWLESNWKTLYDNTIVPPNWQEGENEEYKFYGQLENPRIKQFRFLQKHALLDGPVAASADAQKDAPLPAEVAIIGLPGRRFSVSYQNYIAWLRNAGLANLQELTATGTENFAGAQSLLYLLLRTAVLNQHWDAAMRIYEKVKLKDFPMDDAPIAILKKRHLEIFGYDMPEPEPQASDFNFTFSDPDIQSADLMSKNLSMRQRMAFLLFDPEKVNYTLAPTLISQYQNNIADIRMGKIIQRSKYREFAVRANKDYNANQPMGGPANWPNSAITAQNRLPFLFFNLDKIADLRGKADAKTVNMSTFLKTPRCQNVHFPAETAQLKEFNAHLDILAQLPVAELERLAAEHLDLCSHRLDAWLLAFTNWRLQEQRKNQPQGGLYVGAYGYLENLKPGTKTSSSHGYIHAPTLGQAVAAAIMRAADADAGDNSALRVNLSSARVRQALESLEGIRNGLAATDVLPENDTDKKDAVGDLLLAESVFQLVRGNYDRAAAVLDTLSRAGHPPEPEFIKTPRSGTMLTHRAGISWALNTSSPAGWPSNLSPRALADPSFNFWLGSLLGSAANIVFLFVPEGEGPAIEIPMDALGLHPADWLAMAEGFQNPAGELSIRVRRAAGVKSTEGVIRFDFAAQPGYLTPDATFFLLQKIATLLHSSRPLAPVDWTHPAADPAQTGEIDLKEYRDRFNALSQTFAEWHDGLSQFVILLENGLHSHEFGIMTRPHGGVPALVLQPFPKGEYKALYYSLQESARYGSLVALPAFPDIAGLPDGKTLLKIGKNTLKLLHNKLAGFLAAKALLDNATNATPSVEIAGFGKKAAEVLFEGPVSASPVFTINANSLKSAVKDGLLPPDSGTLRAAQRPLIMEDWLNGIACVREHLNDMESFLLYTDALISDGSAKPRLSPAQLPYRSNDNWVGIELPADYWEQHTEPAGHSSRSSEDPGRKDKLSLVFAFPKDFDNLGACGGILTDEWNELIPSMTQNTGIAFHYNQPNAKAPQSLILATHWNENASSWQMDDLFDCLSSTFRLAKIRAVDPDMLFETDVFGHLLPAVLFKMTAPSLEDDISTDLGVNIGQRVYPSRKVSVGESNIGPDIITTTRGK